MLKVPVFLLHHFLCTVRLSLGMMARQYELALKDEYFIFVRNVLF